jgi:hypothetical protein
LKALGMSEFRRFEWRQAKVLCARHASLRAMHGLHVRVARPHLPRRFLG